mmetsp:Transcript_38810/g.88233  ORF Transcript_38810/g.88233 Transcript_38810/m.88233 type:complete len:117 (-) Transcript_38810:208-558(-)
MSVSIHAVGKTKSTFRKDMPNDITFVTRAIFESGIEETNELLKPITNFYSNWCAIFFMVVTCGFGAFCMMPFEPDASEIGDNIVKCWKDKGVDASFTMGTMYVPTVLTLCQRTFCP